MRAIWATKMRNISAVEVPSDLVTALALASKGFSIRQRKSTVMSQLCHTVDSGQAAFEAPNPRFSILGFLLFHSYGVPFVLLVVTPARHP